MAASTVVVAKVASPGLPDGASISNPTFTGTVTGASAVLSVSGVPFIKAPSGTMGDDGAVSGMTALPRTFAGGAYLYLPAGAIATGVPASPAWYWFVASSTTAGTVYNSTYTSGVPSVGVETAFNTTGPGAFTGVTGTSTAVSITLPANTLGPNGRLEIDGDYSMNATAGVKLAGAKFGARTVMSLTGVGGSQSYGIARAFVHNRGVTGRQIVGSAFIGGGSNVSNAGPTGEIEIDTTAAVTVTMTLLTSGAATDYLILESHRIAYSLQ